MNRGQIQFSFKYSPKFAIDLSVCTASAKSPNVSVSIKVPSGGFLEKIACYRDCKNQVQKS